MTACSMAVTSSRTLIFRRAQVEQQVDHDLAGAVVGDLATPRSILTTGDADILEDVLRLAGLAEGVDRRVLDDPDFVRRFSRAGGREILHGLEGGLVIDPAQAFDDRGCLCPWYAL